MSREIQFYCLNGLNFALKKSLTFRGQYIRNPLADFFVIHIFGIYVFFKTNFFSPVGGLYGPLFKLHKFVMQ